MFGQLRRSRGGCQQLGAAFLIFALLLQGIAFSVAAGRLAASTASYADLAGFELCRHNAEDGANPVAPDGTPQGSAPHCISCLAGASYALDVPVHAPRVHTIVHTIAPWTFTALRLSALTVDAAARPRGPPAAA
jgi:hypothetical protein